MFEVILTYETCLQGLFARTNLQHYLGCIDFTIFENNYIESLLILNLWNFLGIYSSYLTCLKRLFSLNSLQISIGYL